MILFWWLFKASMIMFHTRRVGIWIGNLEWQFLAIDVPQENEQGPLAVENIFAHLAGAHMTRDLKERYWWGEAQQWFSFEIVSIEGYIQFVIMGEKMFRDLIESLIYAQYPDAEITEIEDYTKGFPSKFPDPDYKCWGTEWELVDSHFIPIKTYPEFEDKLVGEFKDPMAAMLETMSRIGKDEHMWYQIIIFPTGQSWKKGGFAMAREKLGKAEPQKAGFLFKVFYFPVYLLKLIVYGFVGDENGPPTYDVDGGSGDDQNMFGIWNLTPGEVDAVKSIEAKVSKIGFLVKVRAVYVAKKEVFDKSRVVYGMVGAIKQYTREDLNALKPAYKKTGTTAHYVFEDYRKNVRRTKIINAFKGRSAWTGVDKFILNVEELATLWHFPVKEVRAPLLQKSGAKRGEAPMGLPMSEGARDSFESGAGAPPAPAPASTHARAPLEVPGVAIEDDGTNGVPDDLPFV